MLNEWSDREPDPPGHGRLATILVGALVACAMLVMIAQWIAALI